MTCVVGLETDKGVIIGVDSASVEISYHSIYQTRLKKVFYKDRFLIGYTTSFRMGQLLQYKLEVENPVLPSTSNRDLEYLATGFVDAVVKCLKDNQFAKVKDEEIEGGQFLVGYQGALYMIDSDFQVNSSRDGYMAIGSGADIALGSLYSTSLKKDHQARVRMALEAASHFNIVVCEPFFIETLES